MNKDQLIEKFSGHEVETVEDMLSCMPGPPTADKFRRLLMLFLRGHLSSAENYDESFAHLACFTWSPVAEDRTLEVGFSHVNDVKNPDAYPGVFVRFGGVSFKKIALGNLAGGSEDGASTFLSKEALLTIVVEFVAGEASDAYDLAEMSSRVLQAMAHPMISKSGASGMEIDGYGEPREKKAAPKDYYTVAMPIRITYTQAVTRQLESHRIRRIAQEIDITT